MPACLQSIYCLTRKTSKHTPFETGGAWPNREVSGEYHATAPFSMVEYAAACRRLHQADQQSGMMIEIGSNGGTAYGRRWQQGLHVVGKRQRGLNAASSNEKSRC